MAINHDAPDTAERPLRTPLESVNPDFALIFYFIYFFLAEGKTIFFFPRRATAAFVATLGWK